MKMNVNARSVSLTTLCIDGERQSELDAGGQVKSGQETQRAQGHELREDILHRRGNVHSQDRAFFYQISSDRVLHKVAKERERYQREGLDLDSGDTLGPAVQADKAVALA